MPTYKYVSGKVSRSIDSLKELKPSKDVSVIIPTFNEEKNIGRLIAALTFALKDYDFEIVVVDDNSKDSTGMIIERLALEGKGKVTALRRFGISGIFSALQDGIVVSKGKTVVIMDADFSHPPEMVPVLVAKIKNADIVAGSRFLKKSQFHAPLSRKYGPMILNSVCRLILGLKATDIFTGFHAMRKDKFRQIEFRFPSVWGEFDMELLYCAQKNKFRIVDVPFSYKYREEGKSKSSGTKIIKFAFAYLARAIELRFSR